MPTIQKLDADRILDSRGEWTLEVTITLGNGLMATASVPKGISAGRYEAKSLPLATAIKNVKTSLRNALRGLDPLNQKQLDQKMIKLDGTANKSRLGGNATLGVSLAAARAGAQISKKPLWKHLSALYPEPKIQFRFPLLFMVMIEGGRHGRGNLEFQEYLMIPKTHNLRPAIEIGTKFYHALQTNLKNDLGVAAWGIGDEGAFSPNLKSPLAPFEILSAVAKKLKLQNQTAFGLDAAASEIQKSAKYLFNFYGQVANRYRLLYLEDAFSETDFDNFCLLLTSQGQKVWIAGDDLTVTNLSRMELAYRKKCINSIVIKPNQIGTLTETLNAVKRARGYGWKVVVSHRGGETNDAFISDLAVAVGADGFKLGAPARGERIAKYNRLLEIEKEMVS